MASQQSINNFVPKYTQPFSLQMAVELDIQTLTNEMTRLGDSLSRLIATQDTLWEVIDAEKSDVDPAISQAYQENVEVIGSQRERIQMIMIALEAKGVSAQSLSHYLGRENPAPAPESLSQAAGRAEDGGIDL